MSLMHVVYCRVKVLATGLSVVQRSPTRCVCVCVCVCAYVFVCVSFSVIRYNNKPLHRQCVGKTSELRNNEKKISGTQTIKYECESNFSNFIFTGCRRNAVMVTVTFKARSDCSVTRGFRCR